MNTATEKVRPLTLNARTAADLMTEQVVSIPETAPLREAVAALVDRGFSGAPVVNEAGRPVGVISLSDIVVRDRNTVRYALPVPEYYLQSDLRARLDDDLTCAPEPEADRTRVADVMTPTVYAVRPDTPAADVIREMVSLRVHRLFVIDRDGVLVGIIATSDVLQRLAA
ncbi:MAG TPA: CBS domain-containing protein [Gemmataceae bacterium]|jgi:CBS domain-containing protein